MLLVASAVDRADGRCGVRRVPFRELKDRPGSLDAWADEGCVIPLRVVVVFAELFELAARVLRVDRETRIAFCEAKLVDSVAPDEAVGCAETDWGLIFLEIATVGSTLPDAAETTLAALRVDPVAIAVAVSDEDGVRVEVHPLHVDQTLGGKVPGGAR